MRSIPLLTVFLFNCLRTAVTSEDSELVDRGDGQTFSASASTLMISSSAFLAANNSSTCERNVGPS